MQYDEWISVKDRLPDDFIHVLTWSFLEGFEVGSHSDISWQDRDGCEYEPSHWMPLPKEP